MDYRFAALALGPLLLVQGRAVRRRLPTLPEPPGDRVGRTGNGPRLRILVTGDSAAAGVGAATQREALTGRLVERLAGDFDVSWRLEARTGATTPDTSERLRALEPAPFDVLVTSLGVNDVTRGARVDTWSKQQRALRSLARSRFGVRHCIVAGLPPMDRFPALPQPLRWFLGRRARAFSGRLARDLAGEEDAEFLDLRFALERGGMATDGFHPGPSIYAGWAERVAARVLARRAGDRDPVSGPVTPDTAGRPRRR